MPRQDPSFLPGLFSVTGWEYSAPMKVMVKLFATLRKGRFDMDTLDCPEGTRVKDIVRRLSIEEKEAAIIFLNSRHAELDTALGEGDTLAIFPPVGGG